jgi:nitrogen regulatory protein P-II 1
VTGHGQQEDPELYRGEEVAPSLIPKVRLEIAVNEAFVEPTIEAIMTAARHGDGVIGDGKIFILPLEEVIRIRTGERGGEAI